jgi:LytS/YehU family sensor histidine kinase
MKYIISNLLLGLVLGFVGLLLPSLRTIKMLEGHYIEVFFIHILASIMLIVFTTLVAKGVMPFMVGNTIGGAIAVSYLSFKKRKK